VLITVTVNEVPRGKQRPRHSRVGSQNTYTPDETVSYEEAVRAAGMAAMDGRPPFQHYPRGLTILVSGFIAIPPSWSLARRTDAYHHRIRPTCKPDWDNIGKATDALNGVVFQDDAQITDGRVLKWYTNAEPWVRVEIWPTEPGQRP
jgi:Holliday junction resolvase RusA-like endonuclease